MRKVALSYLRRFTREMPVRIDIFSISLGDDRQHIEHIRDAFET
jgi:hypothetical protein